MESAPSVWDSSSYARDVAAYVRDFAFSAWAFSASMWNVAISTRAVTASVWAVSGPDSLAVKHKKFEKMKKRRIPEASGGFRKIHAPTGKSLHMGLKVFNHLCNRIEGLPYPPQCLSC